MDVGRRKFIELSAALVATAALPGCASVAAMRVSPTGGAVRLRLAEIPQLAGDGGFLRIQPEGTTSSLYVLAQGGGRYVTVSPICTHLGCTVNVEGERLVCPCHGSTYDRGGAVLRGPAERPLRQYPTNVSDGGELVIQLDGAS